MAELSTLARPYAKAAFEFALAANKLQSWFEALEVFSRCGRTGSG
jgi:F-type H+-transporting ATPase subunit delta